MHQVKIKNIEKWNNAKATDFIKNKLDVADTSQVRESGLRDDTIMTDQSLDFNSMTTVINEEIKTIEHAPMLFQHLRDFDKITDA